MKKLSITVLASLLFFNLATPVMPNICISPPKPEQFYVQNELTIDGYITHITKNLKSKPTIDSIKYTPFNYSYTYRVSGKIGSYEYMFSGMRVKEKNLFDNLTIFDNHTIHMEILRRGNEIYDVSIQSSNSILNMGEDYSQQFNELYNQLWKKIDLSGLLDNLDELYGK